MNSYSQTELPTRDKINDKYKWNLTDIFPNNDAWQAEYDKLMKDISLVADFKGKISASAKGLLDFLNLSNDLDARINKLYIYTSLGKDIDLNDASFKSMFDKSQSLLAVYSSASSFFVPELMTVSDDMVKKFYKDAPGLEPFRQKLESVFLLRKHTLTEAEEKLLAELYPIFVIPGNTYNTLNDAELPFPKIKDDNGNEIQVSHGRYRAGLYSQDRNYRRDIYKATYVPYNMLKGTMADLYIGRATQRITNAKIRKYPSAVEASMMPNNIPVSVYDNLIKVTNGNLRTQHRWASIKKKVLKLDELHPYDTYVSLFPSVNKTYTYDEAVDICRKALAPLGEEYLKAMELGFQNRWIDVFETKSKRSGAYSNSSGAGPHPFILLNWNNTLDDVFTLIHEIGHNMHSFFTEKTQPFQYRDYATFVAEVASTANEALLFEYLLKNATSKEEKLMLFEKFLTSVQATFFRQTEFAEFEKKIHDRMEAGETFSADKLTEEFARLYQVYWGPEMVTDYEEGLSWARIPHLMRYNFYVYQYATGFSAAFALTENIKREGKPAIDRYLKFLASGSSKYPIDILKDAGVDMTKEHAIMALINTANMYLDELESLIK
jgi:oligoendopeptidase F